MTRLLGVMLLLAGMGVVFQTSRLQAAQEALQAAKADRGTRAAEVRAVRPLRAKRALAAADAASAAQIASSAPESWAQAPVPEEIHAALRSFDGPAPGGVPDAPENPAHPLD